MLCFTNDTTEQRLTNDVKFWLCVNTDATEQQPTNGGKVWRCLTTYALRHNQQIRGTFQ